MVASTSRTKSGATSADRVLKRARARLQTDFVFPLGGELILTDRCLRFVPSGASFAHPTSGEICLDFDAIERVEILPGDLDHILGLSFVKRLRVVTPARVFLFQVGEIGSWQSAIEELL